MKKGKLIAVSVAAIIAIGLALVVFLRRNTTEEQKFEEIKPLRGTIRSVVSTTGMVEPKNRLKIKSSLAGRIENILVEEGEFVKKGQELALLSSTERAALLDAARLQGKSEEAYWKKVYKETAILAPLDGQIIVRSIEPGQSVTASDSLFVLSDRLIVKAYVDETDIGQVKVGQKAMISLDAYPEIKVNGTVEHISYESNVQNNVTIYVVDVIPERIPSVFRSGMSANLDIVIEEKRNALLLPLRAVQNNKGQTVVLQKKANDGHKLRYRAIQTGLQDEQYVEVLAGLSDNEIVLLPDTTFVLPSKKSGTNPFVPKRNPAKR